MMRPHPKEVGMLQMMSGIMLKRLGLAVFFMTLLVSTGGTTGTLG